VYELTADQPTLLAAPQLSSPNPEVPAALPPGTPKD
jgi:hypothetical protein